MNKPIYNLFPTFSERIDSLSALALDFLRSLNHDAEKVRICIDAELGSRSWSKVKTSLYKQNSGWRN
jgi:hypothetical protein